MDEPTYPSLTELEAGLDDVSQSPKEQGELLLIVRRPQTDGREILAEAQLDPAQGLVGDDWITRQSRRDADKAPDPENQLTLMNARVIALVAPDPARWPLAGDQLYVDLDLSAENLPAGTRLSIGTAVLQVSAKPHTGCNKFAARFGEAALQFINSPDHKALRLRGVNARIVQPGVIHPGDIVSKI